MNSVNLKKVVGRNVRKYRLIYNAYNKEKLTQAKLAEDADIFLDYLAEIEVIEEKRASA